MIDETKGVGHSSASGLNSQNIGDEFSKKLKDVQLRAEEKSLTQSIEENAEILFNVGRLTNLMAKGKPDYTAMAKTIKNANGQDIHLSNPPKEGELMLLADAWIGILKGER